MTPGPRRVAYVLSRFPKLTETFVLFEMQALEEAGARVDAFPLTREPPGPRHPEAIPYEERAYFAPLLSWRVVRANLRLLARQPRTYLSAWRHALTGTWGSRKLFTRAAACVPKCVYFADRMAETGIDHVHAHFATHPALAAHLIYRLSGIPYSFTAHGSDLHVHRYRRMLCEKVADAAFVVAVSDYNRDLVLEECGAENRERVVVIHCGADSETFTDDGDPLGNGDRRAAGSAPAVANGTYGPSIRIACIASLEKVKGHRFLLEACAMLVERGIDVRCDLAGDGSLREEIAERVDKLGLTGRVEMHGAVPRSEVRRILCGADVAVLASYPTRSGRREGIPVALMEAMMSGLPVVASGLSGIPELVDHGRTGYLVPPGDPWSLADRLHRLVGAPELRRRMGVAGRAKVEREFDLARGARRLLAEIERRRVASHMRDG